MPCLICGDAVTVRSHILPKAIIRDIRAGVRETPALDAIARAVGLQNKYQYEKAVLQALREDSEALDAARGMFGTLEEEISEG